MKGLGTKLVRMVGFASMKGLGTRLVRMVGFASMKGLGTRLVRMVGFASMKGLGTRLVRMVGFASMKGLGTRLVRMVGFATVVYGTDSGVEELYSTSCLWEVDVVFGRCNALSVGMRCPVDWKHCNHMLWERSLCG